MYLKEKTWQSRRDFHGLFECESCQQETERRNCYDDEYFHSVVIPNWDCPTCGEVSPEDGKRTAPSVPAWKVI